MTLSAGAAHAQDGIDSEGRWVHARNAPDLKPRDGNWNFALGAGFSVATGNSDLRQYHADIYAVRGRAHDRFSMYGHGLYSSTAGSTTTDQLSGGMRRDVDLDSVLNWRNGFHFAALDLLRDRPANLSMRVNVGTGLGHHLIREERRRMDVFGGIGYAHERYFTPTVIGGEQRQRVNRVELLIGEESSTEWGSATTLHQRLIVFPSLTPTRGWRAVFDAGIKVAIDENFSLDTNLGYRHNSDPGTGVAKGDFRFVTGLMWKRM